MTKIKQTFFSALKIAIYLILISLCSLFVFSSDTFQEKTLSNYPNFLINNGRLDTLFVVGEFADPEDVLSLTEVATALYREFEMYEKNNTNSLKSFEVDIKGNPYDELKQLYMDIFEKKTKSNALAVLDTSLELDDIKDKNLILFGGPCVNWLSAYFLNYPKSCTEGFSVGNGYIQLFRNGKGIIVMVAGFSKEDTKRAAYILANYKDYSKNMYGTRIKVTSAWIDEIKITERK